MLAIMLVAGAAWGAVAQPVTPPTTPPANPPAAAQPTAQPAAPSDASREGPAAPESPRWAWKPGAVREYEITQHTTAVSTGLLEFDLEQTQHLNIRLTVKDADAGGSATLEIELVRIRVSLKNKAGAVDVDSAAAPLNAEFDPNHPARSLIGIKLTAKASAAGVVSAVDGVPQLKDRIKKAFADQPSLVEMSEIVVGSVTPDWVASTATQFLGGPAPTTPTTLRGLGVLTRTPSTADSLAGGRRTVHRVETYALQSPNTEPIAATFNITLADAEQSTEIVVEPAEGRVVSMTSELSLSYTLTPRNPTIKGGVRRTLNQTTSVTPVDLDAVGPAAKPANADPTKS